MAGVLHLLIDNVPNPTHTIVLEKFIESKNPLFIETHVLAARANDTHWAIDELRDIASLPWNDYQEACTLLMRAVVKPCPDAVRVLLKLGSDVHHVNNVECLGVAAAQDDLETVEIFLDAGVSVDIQSEEGSPLIHAAEFGRRDMIRYLLHRGASTELQFRGRTAENGSAYVVEASNILDGTIVEEHRACWKLLEAVRLSGGYRRFILEPRIKLLVLRVLCERGRASPPRRGILGLLFGETTSRDCFYAIFNLWLSPRDWGSQWPEALVDPNPP